MLCKLLFSLSSRFALDPNVTPLAVIQSIPIHWP